MLEFGLKVVGEGGSVVEADELLGGMDGVGRTLLLEGTERLVGGGGTTIVTV